MNKSKIRKKIFKLRKQKISNNIEIEFDDIKKILKKIKVTPKIIGGYHPYNYEIDTMKILKKFESLEYQISLPKIKKNNQMKFFFLVHN